MGKLQYNAIQLVDFARVYKDITDAEGIISFGNGIKHRPDGHIEMFPEVHLTANAFCKLFDDYKAEPFLDIRTEG